MLSVLEKNVKADIQKDQTKVVGKSVREGKGR